MQQKSEKFLANLDLPLRVSVKLQPAGRATGLESCPYRTQSPDEDSTASEALLLHNWASKNAVLEDEHSIELESGSRKCDLLRTLKHNLSARVGGVVYSPPDTCYVRGEGFISYMTYWSSVIIGLYTINQVGFYHILSIRSFWGL